jgi:hypothetical protein
MTKISETVILPEDELEKIYICLDDHKHISGNDCKSCPDFRVCWKSAVQ